MDNAQVLLIYNLSAYKSGYISTREYFNESQDWVDHLGAQTKYRSLPNNPF